ncbi:hypothetical protein AAMO2058_000875600 [Amorphochlora amoebiformis]|uniref:EamA domain-containing protein n=1 Tax=Amorphochlora amoebiformis TaxID=1561963 RepID=A0A6T6S6X5_9EUKA|mmetsp:Transcript_12584/g.20006  ORF Transcript_12584/g.20006 Transcript_12584/m.20006 type:complete len:353 (+) Transcript_12584:58-1116(+)
MAISSLLGYLIAALSACFNGSFPVPFMIPKVAKCSLHPMLFQLYVSFGVFLSSWLALPFLKYNPTLTGADESPEFPFPPLAMVGGVLFVLSIIFSFAAIPYIGLAMAQGVWGGTAIIVSFLWGVAVFGNEIISTGLATAAIILLLIGVVGIAFCKNIAYVIFRHVEDAKGEPLMDAEAEPICESKNDNTVGIESPVKKSGRGSWLTGILCALAVGLAGGSTLAPLHYISKELSGLASLPAFGCGAMISSPLITIAWFAYTGQRPTLHLKETLWAGILSGTLWNISNVCSIIAIPAISFSVAQPILQCALFVAGLWGIFVFNEIRGWSILVFFVSGTTLLGGAACLALSEINL